MPGIAAGILTAIAGRVGAGLIRRFEKPQPTFADILEAARAAQALSQSSAEADADAQDVDAILAQLKNLPLTTDEARAVAEDLARAVREAKAEADHPGFDRRLAHVVAQFVSRVKSRYNLGAADAAGLRNVAESYAHAEVSTLRA